MAQGRWIMRFGLTFGALLGVAPLAALVLVRHYSIPVSYTHLTLPTIYSV